MTGTQLLCLQCNSNLISLYIALVPYWLHCETLFLEGMHMLESLDQVGRLDWNVLVQLDQISDQAPTGGIWNITSTQVRLVTHALQGGH